MLGIKPNVSILNPRTALSRKYKHGLSKPISMFIKTIHLPNFSLKRSCRTSWQHFAMLLRWYFPRIIIMHLFYNVIFTSSIAVHTMNFLVRQSQTVIKKFYEINSVYANLIQIAQISTCIVLQKVTLKPNI